MKHLSFEAFSIVLAISVTAGCDADKAPSGAAATAATAARAESTAPGEAGAKHAQSAPKKPAGMGPTAARAAEHERRVAAITAAFNAHDPGAIAALYDPECIVLSPSPGAWSLESGREPLVKGHEALFASQPDLRIGTARLFVIGDYVVQEWIANGTHKASGKPVGFQAATVLRFGSDGLVKRDSTYFDLLTPAVQTGRKPGEARPIPPVPAKADVRVAEGSRDESARVTALHGFYEALVKSRSDEVARLLADDVTHASMLAVKDVIGRDAVKKELESMVAALPSIEVTEAWGAGAFAIAEIVFAAPPRDGSAKDARLHALHVVEFTGEKISKSTLYASRREIESE